MNFFSKPEKYTKAAQVAQPAQTAQSAQSAQPSQSAKAAQSAQASDLTAEAIRARKDSDFRETFLKGNKHFILGCAGNATGRHITDADDEWSIALIAFNEAIDSFHEQDGAFRPFAAMVIKRRLIDDLRSKKSREREVATIFPDSETEDLDSATLEIRAKEAALAQRQEQRRNRSQDLQDEIQEAGACLSRYGFSFWDLTSCSPKAGKTKSACARAVQTLLARPALLDSMRRTGSVPAKEIIKETGIPRKILERHRKYIIAAAEILSGEYPLLSEYLESIRRETPHG